MKIKPPAHKCDSEAVSEIIKLDPGTCLEHAPELLKWCYDPNWPISSELSPWLARMGRELLPAIGLLDQTDDYSAKSSVIANVIAMVPIHERKFFFPMLLAWSNSIHPGDLCEGVADIAKDTLKKWSLTPDNRV